MASKSKEKENALDQFSAGDNLDQEPEVGCKPKLSLAMKWTTAELRTRLTPSLNPKAWAKIAESRLFGPKTKPTSREEEKRSSWDAPVEPKQVPSTHRRAKSEIVIRTVVKTHEEPPEVPELPRNISPTGTILIRDVARKTVEGAFEESTVLKSYAKSVQLGVCNDRERCTPEVGCLNDDQAEGKDLDIRGGYSHEEHSKDETRCYGDYNKDKEENASVDISQNLAKIEDTPQESSEEEGEEQFQDCYFPFTSKPRRDTFADFDYVPPNSLVDNAIRNGVWGLNPSELISQEHEREITGLPKCTASRHTKNWRVTNSMLSAYTALRGPYRLAGRDMFVWMDRCGKTFVKPEDCSARVGSCNSIIADLEPLSYDPPPLPDESSQKQVFSIPRPPYEHIRPPPGFNPADHEEPSVELDQDFLTDMKRGVQTWSDDGNGDRLAQLNGPDGIYSATEEFVLSDDEGDPLDGRISPCTFRLWAEGCER
ncbi:hypothetical protein BGZ61DRAFT_528377 [Ilyonectria robusta]|uniref:uncharacterized protein n=1 Tax=Ilyonectria robusta TaxID=1079257 RepID=UPI001E8CA23C|nr:uncharacterized protein BGZ61DRAFT_528377 [Ilyonectria robusta]KAH8735155.1 hypothetical protein BGZ61DRAFT_528377 [Ilyonectria robusta]